MFVKLKKPWVRNFGVKQSNKINRLFGTLIGCLFLGMACGASATQGEMQTEILYPGTSVQKELYDKMYRNKLIVDELYIANPSAELLASVYSFGVEAGLIDPSDNTFRVPESGIENIIPLGQTSPSKFKELIVGKNGEIVGYHDDGGRVFDRAGRYVVSKQSSSVAKAAYTVDLFSMYPSRNFQGVRSAYSTNQQQSVTLSFSSGKIAKSIVIAPQVSLYIYGWVPSLGRYQTYFYEGNVAGRYVNDIAGYDGVYIYEVQAFGPTDELSKRCGTLFKDNNYTGDGLPFYDGGYYNLSAGTFLGWNDAVSSLQMWSQTACDEPIQIVEHSVPVRGARKLQNVRGGTQIADMNNVTHPSIGEPMNDLISDVTTAGEHGDLVAPIGLPTISFENGYNFTGYVVAQNYSSMGYAGCTAMTDMCNTNYFYLSNLTAAGAVTYCSSLSGTDVPKWINGALKYLAGDGVGALAAVQGVSQTNFLKTIGCFAVAAVGRSALVGGCATVTDKWCRGFVDRDTHDEL